MTRDDILRMAREAGSIDSEEVIETVWEAFSAAEREACAKLIESRKTGANELMDAVRDMEALAIRARNEKSTTGDSK